MKRILVPIGCRSDEGLSAPVIKRLKKYFEVRLTQLEPQEFSKNYGWIQAIIQYEGTDLVFITGDRVEMCAAAAAAFHNKVKIAHFYAGVVNDPITTFDDVDRHCITLWSDTQFCESDDAKETVFRLKESVYGHPTAVWDDSVCHVVGISHLDDLVVDESKVPWVMENGTPLNVAKPYDLILYNTQTIGDNSDDIKTIIKLVGDSFDRTVVILGNPDGESAKILIEYAEDVYENLPRPQFLGLLKNCQRFITNSSAAIYEAPHFLKPDQIIMVGDRNKNRPRGPFKTGASDRIVEILKEYLK